MRSMLLNTVTRFAGLPRRSFVVKLDRLRLRRNRGLRTQENDGFVLPLAIERLAIDLRVRYVRGCRDVQRCLSGERQQCGYNGKVSATALGELRRNLPVDVGDFSEQRPGFCGCFLCEEFQEDRQIVR